MDSFQVISDNDGGRRMQEMEPECCSTHLEAGSIASGTSYVCALESCLEGGIARVEPTVVVLKLNLNGRRGAAEIEIRDSDRLIGCSWSHHSA